jgi:hypothetical protein
MGYPGRILDVWVLPVMVSAATNPATIMIAEKTSGMILSDRGSVTDKVA